MIEDFEKWLRDISSRWTLPVCSIRAFNVLALADITTPERLAQFTVCDMLKRKNCGLKTAIEIARMAHDLGQPMALGHIWGTHIPPFERGVLSAITASSATHTATGL